MPNYSVFLIGLHGAGKSTLGRQLSQKHGWCHISIGDLGRLARRGQRPSDFSSRLISELSAYTPGGVMSQRLLDSIALEIDKNRQYKPVVCDGFPSKFEQLPMIPTGSSVVHLHCTDRMREARLDHRASQTKRQWTPGLSSERDNDLPLLLQSLKSHPNRQALRFFELENAVNGIESLEMLALELIKKSGEAL